MNFMKLFHENKVEWILKGITALMFMLLFTVLYLIFTGQI